MSNLFEAAAAVLAAPTMDDKPAAARAMAAAFLPGNLPCHKTPAPCPHPHAGTPKALRSDEAKQKRRG